MIFDAIETFFNAVRDFVHSVIDGMISFIECVTDYFRGLKLRKGRDVPFIADKGKLADIIHQAPVKEIGIFEGTYNEDTDEIENARVIEADELDDRTKEILKDEKLVILS